MSEWFGIYFADLVLVNIYECLSYGSPEVLKMMEI